MKALKRSPWAYIGLTLMLLALLSFSFFPLASSFLKADSSPVTSPSSGMLPDAASKLETEARGYQVVLEREPENRNALQGLLQVRLAQGNLSGSLEPLETLARLNPEIEDYPLLLAQAKQQLGDMIGAEKVYRRLLETNPEDILALKGLTELWIGQGRSQAAINLVQDSLTKALEKVKAGQPADLISLQLLLGEIYVDQERYDEALPLYDLAIESDTEDFRPFLAKALLLRQQGKAQEAEPLWQDAIDRAPIEYKDPIKAIAAQITAPPASN